jgi:hypothetical protein
MEHKLIMENWRRYKEKVPLNESPQGAAWVATTGYEVTTEGNVVSELVEAMIELAIIFLAEPGKVMSSKAWPVLKKYVPKLGVMNYQGFTLTPKALNSAKRRVWREFINTPGIKDKLLKVFSNPKYAKVVQEKLWNTVAPVLGKGLKKASHLYMLYEVFQMSFGLTSIAMKRLGYRTTEDEMGNLDWTGVVKLARDALTGDHAYAKDASKEKYNKIVKSEENFDAWEEDEQIGWCLRTGNAPKNYKGRLKCSTVLDKAEPEEVARIKKIIDKREPAGMTDQQVAMSVPAS